MLPSLYRSLPAVFLAVVPIVSGSMVGCGADDSRILRAYIPNAGDGTVMAIDVDGLVVAGSAQVSAGGSTSHGVAVRDEDGRLFVGDVTGGYLKDFDGVSMDLRAELDLGIAIHGIDLTVNGERLIVSGARLDDASEKVTYVIDAEGLEIVAELQADFSGHATATPDGRYAYITDIALHRIGILDVEEGAMVGELVVGPAEWPAGTVGPNEVAFAPDGQRAWTADYGAQGLTVLDTRNAAAPTIAGFIPLDDLPHGIDVTPDGSELWVASRGSMDVTILDAGTGLERQRVSTMPYQANHVSLTPDGSRAFVTLTAPADREDQRGLLLVLDVRSRAELGRITVGVGPHEVSFDRGAR